jgi:FKBP-type peptidyl-prolyl cis-trans isomerase 2
LPTGAKTGTVLQNREGQPFTVVEISDNAAVVDYNHPLAGKRLVFDVKVLKVEDLS